MHRCKEVDMGTGMTRRAGMWAALVMMTCHVPMTWWKASDG